MSTATHSRASSARSKGQRELATLKSLETLTNAGLLQDGMSIILRAYHSLQEEPSRLSAYVNSLNISHDDLKTALTAFHPCPETQRRFDAAREAVNKDIELRDCNEAIEMAKEAGDSVREDILRRNRKVFITRSAVSWAKLVRTTLEDREEWESQLQDLEMMPSGGDTEDSNGS